MATRAEIRAKILAAKEGGRSLAIVMTETGEFSHLQGTWTKTLCGRDIDRDRIEPDETYPCLSCQKSSRSRF